MTAVLKCDASVVVVAAELGSTPVVLVVKVAVTAELCSTLVELVWLVVLESSVELGLTLSGGSEQSASRSSSAC